MVSVFGYIQLVFEHTQNQLVHVRILIRAFLYIETIL